MTDDPPVRVLHVVASGQRRGAELFASDLVRALADDGLEQRVVIVRSGAVAVDFAAPVTELGANGRGMPPLRVRLGPTLALRRMVERLRPDVVQAHGGEPLKYAALATLGGKAALVYRRIGAPPDAIGDGPRRVAYARLMRRASRVVAVAASAARDTTDRFGVPAARVAVIPNAVDVSRTRPAADPVATRSALGLSRSQALILSVGALTWEKDPLGAVDVAAGVLRRVPGSVYATVGDGPLRERLEQRALDPELGGRVLVLGSRRDVADLMAAADVLLLASATEGMPACVIEAGLAGLPVAAYTLGGVPEVVTDGETGVLAGPGDRRALTERLLELVGDQAARRRMGAAARARCRDFDIRRVAPRYLELYRELRAEQRRAAVQKGAS